MVVIAAIEIFNVQRDPGCGGKAHEPMLDEFGVPFAQSWHGKRRLPDKIGSPRYVQRTAGERFIHRRIGAAIARNAALIAQSCQYRFTDGDAGIFGRVMLINMQIADGLYLQIDERMFGKLFEHMVEKSDPGRHVIHAAAIEIDGNINRGFVGLAADRSGSHGRRYSQPRVIGKHKENHNTLDLTAESVHQTDMSEEHPDSLIPYDDVVQEALRAVVGRVLGEVAANGLPGDHHFYITFKTQAPGVAIPTHLHERFPDEMTIVIQHKYWDLKVEAQHFEVGLSFSQIPSHLFIPYSAITAFVDPCVDFALQFHVDADEVGPEPHEAAGNDEPSVVVEDGSNVVSVDFGRKK